MTMTVQMSVVRNEEYIIQLHKEKKEHVSCLEIYNSKSLYHREQELDSDMPSDQAYHYMKYQTSESGAHRKRQIIRELDTLLQQFSGSN